MQRVFLGEALMFCVVKGKWTQRSVSLHKGKGKGVRGVHLRAGGWLHCFGAVGSGRGTGVGHYTNWASVERIALTLQRICPGHLKSEGGSFALMRFSA